MKFNPPPRKEISLKRQMQARKRRKEYMERWSIKMSQLKRLHSETGES